ncbi:MAG: type II and III secretion system protein family protein [Pseudomonadota bacterium]
MPMRFCKPNLRGPTGRSIASERPSALRGECSALKQRTRHFRGIFAVLYGLGALFAIATSAYADEYPPESHFLRLELSQSEEIRLTEAATFVLVADPTIADVQKPSETLLFVIPRNAGRTSIKVFGEDEQIISEIQVQVTPPRADLEVALRRVLPDETVDVDFTPTGAILTGSVSEPGASTVAEATVRQFLGEETELLNRIVTARPTQVMLRVRIAEVAREVTERLGVDWSAAAALGGANIGLSTGGGVAAAASAAESLGLSTALVEVSRGGVDAAALFRALRAEGLVRVLAEPTLTVRTGEVASFLSGGRLPIPIPNGDNGTAIDFVPFGVSLEFTPNVVSDEQISLTISSEASNVSDSNAISVAGFSIPSISTRRVATSVTLGDGQTLVVAGLLQNDAGSTLNKTPVFGDIPLIGSLFRSTTLRKSETELLVFVTPVLTRGTTERLSAPSEFVDVEENSVKRLIPDARAVVRRPETRAVGFVGDDAEFLLDTLPTRPKSGLPAIAQLRLPFGVSDRTSWIAAADVDAQPASAEPSRTSRRSPPVLLKRYRFQGE